MLGLVEGVGDCHDDWEVVRDGGGERLLSIRIFRRSSRVDGTCSPGRDVGASTRTSASRVCAGKIVLDEARVAGMNVGLAWIHSACSGKLAADGWIARICMTGLVKAIRDVVVRPLVVEARVLRPLDSDSVRAGRQHVETVGVRALDGAFGVVATGVEIGVSRLATRLTSKLSVDANEEVLSLVERVRYRQHNRVVVARGDGNGCLGFAVRRRRLCGTAVQRRPCLDELARARTNTRRIGAGEV